MSGSGRAKKKTTPLHRESNNPQHILSGEKDMNDKLAYLREAVNHVNPSGVGLLRQGPSVVLDGGAMMTESAFDLEAQMGLRREKQGVRFIADISDKLDSLTDGIARLKENIKTIHTLKRRSIQSTSTETDKQVSNELNDVLSSSNTIAIRIKRSLEELKEENRAFAAKNPNSSECKIRDNFLSSITTAFKVTLKEYQSVQTDFKKETRDKVIRQTKIVFPEEDDEEVARLVDSGQMNGAAAIRMKISGGQIHEGLTNVLADIKDKYRDIQKLEQSVVELHQMFVDISTLVDAQGEMLDRIDFSVNSAKDYTEKGEKELVLARQDQKRAKKKMFWLSVCVVVLAFAIVVPIIVVVTR